MQMVTFGYALSSEETTPRDLVRHARIAEESVFAFASISDHFHPWVSAQGHSPFVWSVLGAIAEATEEIEVGIGVSCPIVRIHPAITAHASATASLLFEGRFFLGLGTGEALNEHILGHRWPPAPVRLAMLEEAIGIIRGLWEGETFDHRGAFYEVENARLFDAPDPVPPIVVSAFGPKAADLAGRLGDGYWGTGPTGEIIDAYRGAGGSGPTYGQINLCWAEDEATGRKTIREIWPNAGLAGQLSQDLPTPKHFEDATSVLTEEQVVGSVPCGPDVGPVVQSVRTYVDAGYDHLYFHQVGPDQEGFFRFWNEELKAAIAEFAGRDL
jgi:coenzyme F420-dependent glucose-6-phosphate dehydrogenase